MSVVGFSILFATVAVLALLSVWSDRRMRNRERLPMQWAISGKVNWTAPRQIALAFTPVLATVVLAIAALRYADEPNEPSVLTSIACVFVVAHLLYLWLVQKRATS